ncbi:MAG: elongation factor P [Acidimicrobiia bacterium]
MISTTDVRHGMALDLPEGLFAVLEHQHVKPGKGKAFVRMKLRNLDSGAVVERTFRAGEDVPRAMVDRRRFQFLYRDGEDFHFMDLETYNQIALMSDVVGDAAGYLVDGAEVTIPLFRDRPLAIDLPTSVELTVTYAEPAVKGDRASGATKPVTLETGLVVHVPLFIDTGDRLKVDTRSGQYITRTS